MHAFGTRRVAQLVVSKGASELDAEQAAWLIGLMADQDRRLMVVACRETMAFDSRRRLAETACPTLVIAGSHDRAVPLHHARMLHEGIAGSRLVIVEGAGHTLIWTHPDEFVRVTEEFIAGQCSGRGETEAVAGPV